MEGMHEPLPRSPEEFLLWAEGQEEKHELVDGVVVMQAGASRNHERVAKRIFASLLKQVDETEFDVNKGDFGVRIKDGNARGSVLLPDVLVDLQSEHGEERATATPVVVIEVLSPSTDLRHHVEKLAKYARLESLASYAVFSQDGPEVHLWRRTQEGWPDQPVVLTGMEAIVDFPEIDASVSMSEIYAPVEPKRTWNPG